MKLPEKSITKKRLIIITVAVIIAVLSVKTVISVLPEKHTADEIITTSIRDLKKQTAISFKTESKLEIDNKERTFGEIEGELLNNGDFHICGDLLGSKTEIFQIGNSTYRKDNLTGNWLKTSENTLLYQTALFNETNPLEQFEFTEYTSAEIIDCDEKNTTAVKFSPNTESDTITQYFSDITYIIYCNKDLTMKKVLVSGNLKNNSVQGKLYLTTEFSVLPADYTIEPPIIDNQTP